MIDEKKALSAEQWIYDNVDNIANAKAERVKKEETIRVVKSEIILATDGSVAHKEATALASPEYKKAVEEYSEAVRSETHYQIKLKAAETRIDLFRSINKTLRDRI